MQTKTNIHFTANRGLWSEYGHTCLFVWCFSYCNEPDNPSAGAEAFLPENALCPSLRRAFWTLLGLLTLDLRWLDTAIGWIAP
jgi:hypothetical protein